MQKNTMLKRSKLLEELVDSGYVYYCHPVESWQLYCRHWISTVKLKKVLKDLLGAVSIGLSF